MNIDKKIATRQSYGEKLAELGEKNDNIIVFDADLAGAIFQGADLMNSDFSLSENLNACRFDEDTTWPDNEYLPEDFDSRYSSDLSSLKDDDDFEQSEY